MVQNKTLPFTFLETKGERHFKHGGMIPLAIWKLKSCPRCNGDLFIQRETDGWYEECLLCGYEKDVSNLVTVNTVGQIKIKDKIDAGQILYTDIQVLPDD
jgi:hypothetical protein